MKKTLGFLATTALLAACGNSKTAQTDDNKNTSPLASADQNEIVRCFGINSCSSYAKCAVTAADVEATKRVFGDKFAATELHECAGLAKCAAASGQLNWVQVSRQECAQKEGFLITNAADGTKVVNKI
ncbi:MAG: hypothetical protein ACO3A4_07760 [Silvanigrellaceae bacterium]